MTFAAVVAAGTPKATPQEFRPSRSILRPLPENDAFGDQFAPGRHRVESMTSTSSSGSERVGAEGANFSGYVRQSAARQYPTGLGPIRLVHVCRDEEDREIVLVAGDCAEEQPAYLRAKAKGRPLLSSSMGGSVAGRSPSTATPKASSQGANSSTAHPARGALLRTPNGAFVVDGSPGPSPIRQPAPSGSLSGSTAGMSGLSSLRASGWPGASSQPDVSLSILKHQVGHLQVWEAGML